MFELFEDQAEFVGMLRQSLQAGHKSILGVASPAFGKTVVAAHITETARAKNPDSTIWFLVHRKNLLRQTSKSFWAAHIEHGLLTSGRRASKLPIQVGTIGTVNSRFNTLSPPSILFIDEAHLARGAMFERVISWARDNGSIVIGLTGTPERLDGKALGDLFDDLIEAKSTKWLIEQGRLSEYIAFTTPMGPPLDGVKKSGGDFNKSELAAAMDKPTIVGDAVSHWRKHANGMRTVAYCVNVAHNKHTADAFNQAGIPAAHVDADTTEAELKAVCEGLADRSILVLCNCELVIEGFDLSAQVGRDVTLECCILLRPTQSVARYLQMVFRALRRKPQPAVILDHAGCIMKHGLPCESRDWTLDGQKKGKRKAKDDAPDVQVQQCMKCYAVFKPSPDNCPMCGEVIERKVRKIEQIDGELQAVDMEMVRRERKREQGMAQSLGELIQLGRRRGMKKPEAWAAITFAARQGRKPTSEEFQESKRIGGGV